MDSTDFAQLQRRARVAYEIRRARNALLGIAPFAIVVVLAAYFGHRPRSTWLFGSIALATAALMLWYGRDPQRAVLPGFAAGVVPLILALCANRFHSCGPEGCASLCVPACTLGGVIAGLAVAAVGRQRKAGLQFWLSASGMALLTGSMGCACIGYSGLAGLGLGFAAGLVPGLLRKTLGGKVS